MNLLIKMATLSLRGEVDKELTKTKIDVDSVEVVK